MLFDADAEIILAQIFWITVLLDQFKFDSPLAMDSLPKGNTFKSNGQFSNSILSINIKTTIMMSLFFRKHCHFSCFAGCFANRFIDAGTMHYCWLGKRVSASQPKPNHVFGIPFFLAFITNYFHCDSSSVIFAANNTQSVYHQAVCCLSV